MPISWIRYSTFGNNEDVISQRGHSHKGGREKSRRCMAETAELPEQTD
ncbi:hypothetical protein GN109_05420 [Collimonas pratensis]|nr:hypothetical protein [Collimonas pratensis]NKI68853.1 hypothetical protein [Collimonas pratensis]